VAERARGADEIRASPRVLVVAKSIVRLDVTIDNVVSACDMRHLAGHAATSPGLAPLAVLPTFHSACMQLAQAILLTVAALAALASSMAALLSVRDARSERRGRSFTQWVGGLRAAHAGLGNALLELAASLQSLPRDPQRYELARLLVRYALDFALHPDIEDAYGTIVDLLGKPPNSVTLADIEEALAAVFNSFESVGDVYRRRLWE
jgi:hypothetical protein